MPSTEVGAEQRRNRALNCWPWVRSFTHSPEAVIHSPAGRGVANHRHNIAVTTRFRAQDAEAVVGVVEGDALDHARQDFLSRRSRLRLHLFLKFLREHSLWCNDYTENQGQVSRL